MKQIAEEQVNPQTMQQVAPDVVSPQGQQELQARRIAAGRVKGVLDTAFQMAAKTVNGSSSSRIKDFDTAIKKLVQKRLSGRKDYDMSDINDLAGFRITINKQSDLKPVLKEIKDMQSAGLFKILKSEPVTTGTYTAHHVDFITSDNVKGELQIMTPQQKATSMVNHSLRSQFGENPPPAVKKLQDAQASLTNKASNPKAEAISKSLEQLMKQNNNNPLHPVLTAAIAQQAQQ